MRNTIVSLLVLVAIALPLIAVAADERSPSDRGGSEPEITRAVNYLYESPLVVWEEITDIGGGLYLYSYSFQNVDSNHIWFFGVWTEFYGVAFNTTFDGHPEWSGGAYDVADILEVYDARNLDPDIVMDANTWGPGWPNTTDPINPGDSVEGFSYTAPVYDDSPKWYFYETIESGYAGDTGYVAAVGLTGVVVATENTSLSRVKALFE